MTLFDAFFLIFKDKPDIKGIGVDDVCLKKGQSYYTVIYDGEDHHLLALLKGRDGEELKKWLETHPKIGSLEIERVLMDKPLKKYFLIVTK